MANNNKTGEKKILINEDILMCSGVGCDKKLACWRYRLNHLYDRIKQHPHPNPRWVTPAFDAQSAKCHFFVKVEYMPDETN